MSAPKRSESPVPEATNGGSLEGDGNWSETESAPGKGERRSKRKTSNRRPQLESTRNTDNGSNKKPKLFTETNTTAANTLIPGQIASDLTTVEGQLEANPKMGIEEAKAQAKREYNRQNAARARVRNKEMVDDLQKKVASLTKRTEDLQRENDVLRAQVKVLSNQQNQNSSNNPPANTSNEKVDLASSLLSLIQGKSAANQNQAGPSPQMQAIADLLLKETSKVRTETPQQELGGALIHVLGIAMGKSQRPPEIQSNPQVNAILQALGLPVPAPPAPAPTPLAASILAALTGGGSGFPLPNNQNHNHGMNNMAGESPADLLVRLLSGNASDQRKPVQAPPVMPPPLPQQQPPNQQNQFGQNGSFDTNILRSLLQNEHSHQHPFPPPAASTNNFVANNDVPTSMNGSSNDQAVGLSSLLSQLQQNQEHSSSTNAGSGDTGSSSPSSIAQVTDASCGDNGTEAETTWRPHQEAQSNGTMKITASSGENVHDSRPEGMPSALLNNSRVHAEPLAQQSSETMESMSNMREPQAQGNNAGANNSFFPSQNSTWNPILHGQAVQQATPGSFPVGSSEQGRSQGNCQQILSQPQQGQKQLNFQQQEPNFQQSQQQGQQQPNFQTMFSQPPSGQHQGHQQSDLQQLLAQPDQRQQQQQQQANFHPGQQQQGHQQPSIQQMLSQSQPGQQQPNTTTIQQLLAQVQQGQQQPNLQQMLARVSPEMLIDILSKIQQNQKT